MSDDEAPPPAIPGEARFGVVGVDRLQAIIAAADPPDVPRILAWVAALLHGPEVITDTVLARPGREDRWLAVQSIPTTPYVVSYWWTSEPVRVIEIVDARRWDEGLA